MGSYDRTGHTIKDVAAGAGVSITSVSHTLSGSRHVSPATAEKVWRAVKELGYQPSHSARGLRRGQTGNIGVVVPDMGNLFYTSLARAVHTLALAAGYQLLMRNSDDSLDQEESAVRKLLAEKMVDGIVLVPSHGSHRYLRELLDKGAKVVVVNRRLSDVQAPMVTGDNEEASCCATKHLLALGHRRLAVIAHPEGISTGDDRVSGFCRALADQGIRSDMVWRHPPGSQRAPRCAAYEATCQLLRAPHPPTALLAASHQYAEGVVMAIRDLGVPCPESVALVAFGSSWAAQVLNPVLTVMQQNIEGISRAAMDLLLIWLRSKEMPLQSVVVKADFVIGDSCGWRGQTGNTMHDYCRRSCLEAQGCCPERESCPVRAGCSGRTAQVPVSIN